MKSPTTTRLGSIAGLALLTGLGAATTGCAATVRTGVAYDVDVGGVAVVYDDAPAWEFETYPRYFYGGTYVYLVGDRWYFRSGDRWAYYRDEPPALLTYRRDYYVASGYREPPRYGAPPAYRGRYEAPTAYQGRYEAPTGFREHDERRAEHDSARGIPAAEERALPGYRGEPPGARDAKKRKDKRRLPAPSDARDKRHRREQPRD
jgi:hypothetical protein